MTADAGRTAAPLIALLSFRADPAVAAPAGQQLRERILADVQSGALPPGTRLPTVRALAEAAGLAPNTVAGAYRALDAGGVIEGRGRAGTFVSLAARGDAAANAAAHDFAERARELGLSDEDAVTLVREALAARRTTDS